MNLKGYQLPLGWTVSFPEQWQHEYTEDDAQNIFYPENSDLTFRITAFHAEKEGVPAEPNIMYMVLARSLPENAEQISLPELKITGCKTHIVRTTETENGKQVTRIIAGTYCEGELLITNIFGTNPQEVTEAMAYLCFISRR